MSPSTGGFKILSQWVKPCKSIDFNLEIHSCIASRYIVLKRSCKINNFDSNFEQSKEPKQ